MKIKKTRFKIILYFNLLDFESKISEFESIFFIFTLSEANPNNLTLLANCARLEEARGELGEAEKVFEKILGLDPVNQEALCVLAASKYYKDEPMNCLS